MEEPPEGSDKGAERSAESREELPILSQLNALKAEGAVEALKASVRRLGRLVLTVSKRTEETRLEGFLDLCDRTGVPRSEVADIIESYGDACLAAKDPEDYVGKRLHRLAILAYQHAGMSVSAIRLKFENAGIALLTELLGAVHQFTHSDDDTCDVLFDRPFVLALPMRKPAKLDHTDGIAEFEAVSSNPPYKLLMSIADQCVEAISERRPDFPDLPAYAVQRSEPLTDQETEQLRAASHVQETLERCAKFALGLYCYLRDAQAQGLTDYSAQQITARLQVLGAASLRKGIKYGRRAFRESGTVAPTELSDECERYLREETTAVRIPREASAIAANLASQRQQLLESRERGSVPFPEQELFPIPIDYRNSWQDLNRLFLYFFEIVDQGEGETDLEMFVLKKSISRSIVCRAIEGLQMLGRWTLHSGKRLSALNSLSTGVACYALASALSEEGAVARPFTYGTHTESRVTTEGRRGGDIVQQEEVEDFEIPAFKERSVAGLRIRPDKTDLVHCGTMILGNISGPEDAKLGFLAFELAEQEPPEELVDQVMQRSIDVFIGDDIPHPFFSPGAGGRFTTRHWREKMDGEYVAAEETLGTTSQILVRQEVQKHLTVESTVPVAIGSGPSTTTSVPALVAHCDQLSGCGLTLGSFEFGEHSITATVLDYKPAFPCEVPPQIGEHMTFTDQGNGVWGNGNMFTPYSIQCSKGDGLDLINAAIV